MALNPLANGTQNIALERNKVITITPRTVRSGLEVYQTHNISSFGEGEVDIGKVPWVVIILFFIIGSISNSINQGYGILFLLLSIAGIVWNFVKPKHYGFLIALNSGDKKLFITTDKPGIKQVASQIYDIIEAEKEATYQVSINNSQIKGNFIQGYAGNVSYDS